MSAIDSIGAIDTLDIRIKAIRFHKPSKYNPAGVPFLIAQTTTGAIIKGEMRRPIIGESYRLWGEWKEQKGYKEPAFEFSSFEPVVDQSADGVSQYLMTHVIGLGPAKSRAIVEHFGGDTLMVMRKEPERAAQVAGITPEIVESIRRHFADQLAFDPVAYARLIDLFSGHKTPKSVLKRLLKDWGSNAPDLVTERPYVLLDYPRMGWKIVDSFALAVAKYDPEGLDRHVAALRESLERIAAQGHTYDHKVNIESETFQLLSTVPRSDSWAAAVEAGYLVAFADIDADVDEKYATTEPDEYGLPKLAEAEAEIARRLAILYERAKPLAFNFNDSDGGGDLDFNADLATLNEDQRAAIDVLQRHGVALLIGAPGVGKTWTITTFIACLLKHGVKSIRIVAPTGKAAKRAAELLEKKLGPEVMRSIPTTTIHKALGPKPNDGPEGVPADGAKHGRGRDEFSFSCNEHHPIEADFLVVDETSMVDVQLGASLLRAIAPGTRVVFVGDQNQLPSVGPGSVLRDLIAGGLPTATLTKVQRNAGRIVRACHAIKDGVVPEPAKTANLDPEVGDNWLHIEIKDPNEIAAQIVELHRPYQNFPDPTWDMQVVTPQRSRLPIACANLNKLLSAKLNTFGNVLGDGAAGYESDGGGDEGSGFAPPFRRGDKVVRTKNGLCQLMTLVTARTATLSVGGKVAATVETKYAARDVATQRREAAGARNTDDDLMDADALADTDTGTKWSWDGYTWSLTETEIVNGDMGQVLDIVEEDDSWFVVVEFRTPMRTCRLPYDSCHLTAAYALTCHKAQGSGFPYVIVPVHGSFYFDAKTGNGIFTREWIYTAKSRAEKLLVTVGEFDAIRAAVGRKTVHRRKTRLAGLVREALGGATATTTETPIQ